MMYKVFKGLKTANDQCEFMSKEQVEKYLKVGNNVGYEGLFGAVKPYFDFDVLYTTRKEQRSNEFNDIRIALDSVCSFLKCDEKDCVIFTANGKKAKSKWINSIHIVVNNNATYSCGKDILANIRLFDGWDGRVKPDQNVYASKGKRQLFRLPYCIKEGEAGRPFVLTTFTGNSHIKKFDTFESTECEDIGKWLVTHTSSKMPESNESTNLKENTISEKHEDKKTEQYSTIWGKFIEVCFVISQAFVFDKAVENDGNILINTKRLYPSYCDLCEREHDNDNTLYLQMFNDGKQKKLMRGCIRSKNKMSFIWTDAPENDKEKKKKSADEIFKDMVLSKSTTFDSLKKRFKDTLKRANVNTIYINSDYCNKSVDLMDHMKNDASGIISIKSNMGTGKTRANSDIVKELVKSKPDYRCGVISFRTSLAKQYKSKYEGFTSYLDKKKLGDRWICQLDSINKVEWKKNPVGNQNQNGESVNDLNSNSSGEWLGDMLVIDEAHQAIVHLTSRTYMKQKRTSNNRKMLYNLIRNTKRLVLMDANLTADDIMFIQSIRNQNEYASRVDRPPVLIYNEYSDKTRTLKLTRSPADVISLIEDDLHNGRKFYLAHNGSVEKILTIKDVLCKEKNYNILVVCSKTLKHEAVDALIKNPDDEIHKYDGIIVSPSVQSGLSIDKTDTIDRVYGIFGNATNSSGDACQMLERVRHPVKSEMIIAVEKFNTPSRPTTYNEYVDWLISNRTFAFTEMADDAQDAEILDGDYNRFGLWEFKNDLYFSLFVKNRVAAELDRQNWLRNFIQHQISYGNKIELYTNDKNAEKCKAIKKSCKDTLELRQKIHNDTLSNTIDISYHRFDELKTIASEGKEKHNLTDEEENQMERYILKDTYGVKSDTLTSEWFNVYNNKQRIRHFVNQIHYFEGDTPECLESGLENLRLKEVRAEKRNRQTEQGERADTDESITKSLLKDYKFERHKILLEWLKIFGITESLDSRDVPELDEADVKSSLVEIHKKYMVGDGLKRLIAVMGKDVRKMKTYEALTPDDGKFVRKILDFINGGLKSEWGVSICKTDKAKTDIKYKFTNESVVCGYFMNPYKRDCAVVFGNATPVLGKPHEFEFTYPGDGKKINHMDIAKILENLQKEKNVSMNSS